MKGKEELVRKPMKYGESITGLFAFCLLWAIIPANCDADCLWLKNESGRQFGFIVNETDTEISLADRIEPAEQIIKTFKRSEIERVVRTIDISRLEKLRPLAPSGYRDYAEELLRFRDDPIAMSLAKKLFAISVAVGDSAIRASALKGLTQLPEAEQHADEIRRIQMFYVFGTAVEPTTIPQAPISDQEALLLETLTRAIRREQWDEASKLLDQAKNVVNSSQCVEFVSWKELADATKNRAVSRVLLLKLLRFEQHLKSASNEIESSMASDTWAVNSSKYFSGEPQLPDLQFVVGEDCQKTIFRNKEWVKQY